jgi:hypothetical protein
VQGVVLTFPGWDPAALDHLVGSSA